ncbi:parathyroid hormone/parathyroid hormone-related peptide receptor [Hyalella azteca]|uniref:Parathyroid hormone/parathyroid hormone-related peptide receptor n=1 Tax=Hyalella azteca TaxID=294128 RepID=A0A8B7NML4_HYAAZ|nr:parathyroid hormone/parathyroid hormone-related peptide receptor [Hyalella azteca]
MDGGVQENRQVDARRTTGRYDVGWTDYSQCLRRTEDDDDDLSLIMAWLPFLKKTSLIGYSISLITLTISFIILAALTKLRCPRNMLHLHLFASFILRAAVVLLRSSVLSSSMLTPSPTQTTTANLNPVNDTWWCRLVISIWQYFITANYSWILMEGLYLHNLIFRALFTDSSAITLYIVLGWGLPLVLVGSWACVRAAIDDSHCWMLHKKSWIFLVLIRIPVAFSVFLNFFFFINIVRVLTLKLRSSVSDENMKYRKLAKSTLVLVPLFGVHYCLLWGLSTFKHPTVELAWLIMDQVFASFQGFFVALLYCLMNGEVRQELKKMYHSRFGGGEHTLFTGQSTMVSHTRVYTSWWAKIRARILLCCRPTRTSIHSIHSMTDRKDRQSPSPKMPQRSADVTCGKCGNSCEANCGSDCRRCGEVAILVCATAPSYSQQRRSQKSGLEEELIELQDRNHVETAHTLAAVPPTCDDTRNSSCDDTRNSSCDETWHSACDGTRNSTCDVTWNPTRDGTRESACDGGQHGFQEELMSLLPLIDDVNDPSTDDFSLSHPSKPYQNLAEVDQDNLPSPGEA